MPATPKAAASRRTGCKSFVCEFPEPPRGAWQPCRTSLLPASRGRGSPELPNCPCPAAAASLCPTHTLEYPRHLGARRTESSCGLLAEDASPRSGAAGQPPLSPRPWLLRRGPGLAGQLCGSSEKLCCTLSLISLAALTCKLLMALKPGWISLEHFSVLAVTQRTPSVHSTSSSGGTPLPGLLRKQRC